MNKMEQTQVRESAQKREPASPSHDVWMLVENRRRTYAPEGSMVYDLNRFLTYDLDDNSLVAKVTGDSLRDFLLVDWGVYFTRNRLRIDQYQRYSDIKNATN
jgi:hypothetical protein